MEGPLGNATPTASLHQSHWWKSPRWIVIRIEALATVAIIISFLLVAFGSCRRWSNSWIVQKGFFAAQVLSLSLGTYSIGVMQSSSVKSQMYPVWTVSLFTLFGCIDPVTTYNGLDYKGPLSKVVYGICLNCGYVLLMCISTISNIVGNTAIITLSAITFIKGFHRSFALVQQNRMRNIAHTDVVHNYPGETCIIRQKEPSPDLRHWIIVDPDTNLNQADTDASIWNENDVNQADIDASIRNNNNEQIRTFYDVCVAFCLSHSLRRHILGLDYRVPHPENLKGIGYEWALKIIEIELAFVYDALFTGNPFLHYYQAKTASLWALASFTGICFVLVATAIPGGMPRRPGGSSCTKVVNTTATDLAITFGILVSLALLQLKQLIRSWTSNWARAAVACAYARKDKDCWPKGHLKLSGWMRLKASVANSTNLFERYLWQDKISQYSMLPEPRLLIGVGKKAEGISSSQTEGEQIWSSETKDEQIWSSETKGEERKDEQGYTKGEWIGRCVHLLQMLGLHYIWQVIQELFSSDTNKRGGVKLDRDVKGSIIEFLGQIQSDRLDRNWLLSLPEDPRIRHFLPHYSAPRLLKQDEDCYRYTSCVMTWHIVTWYCELEEQSRQEDALMSKQEEAPIGCCGRETAAGYYLRKAAAAIPRPNYYFRRRRRRRGVEGGRGTQSRDHRHVANALSQYCVYLVKSAPELLPGPVAWMKHVYGRFAQEAKRYPGINKRPILAKMPERIFRTDWYAKGMDEIDFPDYRIQNGQALAKLFMRRSDPWETLALVWVQLLVYAAPYGNVEAHMRHLSQGGEFITHLWALLYHLDIRQWKVQGNLAEIATREDAERVLTEDSQAVVAFLNLQNLQGTIDQDELANASCLDDGVRYYYTSDSNIAEIFRIKGRTLVFLKKKANNHKFTFYDGKFRAYDIAHFVSGNRDASAHDQAQARRLSPPWPSLPPSPPSPPPAVSPTATASSSSISEDGLP